MGPGYRDLGYKTPKTADISDNTDGFTVIAAAADSGGLPGTGKKYLILSLSLSAVGAGPVTLRSNNTVRGRNTFKATDPAWVLPYNPDGWCVVEVGEAFKIGNSSLLTLTGICTYIELGGGVNAI